MEWKAFIGGLCLSALPILGWADLPDSWCQTSPLARKPMPNVIEIKPEQPHPALSLSFETGSGMSTSDTEYWRDIVVQALLAVAKYPPKDSDNVFSWNGDPTFLIGKTCILRLTKSDDPILHLADQAPGEANADIDSGTIFEIKPDGESQIVTFILLDKILEKKQENEQSVSLERLIVVLAYEIYGNVQRYLKMDPKQIQSQTVLGRWHEQIQSSHVVDFLAQLMTSAEFEKMPASERQKFINILKREH